MRFITHKGCIMTSVRSTLIKYVSAVAAIGAAVLLRRLMDPVMGPDAPYITVYPTVILVAVLFGPGPGIFAGTLGVIAAQIWLTGPFGVFKFTLADFWCAAFVFTS